MGDYIRVGGYFNTLGLASVCPGGDWGVGNEKGERFF